jgi:hypothetical protein
VIVIIGLLDLQRFVCRIPLSDQFPRPGMLRTDCALFLDVLVRQVYYIMYLVLINPPPPLCYVDRSCFDSTVRASAIIVCTL